MLLQHHDRHHDHQSSSFHHPKEGYAVPMSSVEPTGISGSIAYCLSDGAATGSASDPRANFAAQASVLLVLALHRSLLDLGADDGSNVVHRSGQFHVVNSMTLMTACQSTVVTPHATITPYEKPFITAATLALRTSSLRIRAFLLPDTYCALALSRAYLWSYLQQAYHY